MGKATYPEDILPIFLHFPLDIIHQEGKTTSLGCMKIYGVKLATLKKVLREKLLI